jgi:hypothetical protein
MPGAAAAHSTTTSHDGTSLPPVLFLSSPHFTLAIYSNCTAVATDITSSNSSASVPEPLLQTYNRVSDNHQSDWGSCVGASLTAPGVVHVVTANVR